jgi:hypothetical protein
LFADGVLWIAGVANLPAARKVFALAFAFTAKMAVVTVVSYADQAMADSAGTVIMYPEQASKCNETNC